jgi:hypothetical protein
MPRKPRPAVETYEQVSRERKSELRRDVRGALSEMQATLLALAADDAERAIVAQEYLQQHTAGSKIGETVMGTWSDIRLRALKALRSRGLKPTDLAGHLGLTLTRIDQILAPGAGRSRQVANASAAVRRAPEGGPVGRPATTSKDSDTSEDLS